MRQRLSAAFRLFVFGYSSAVLGCGGPSPAPTPLPTEAPAGPAPTTIAAAPPAFLIGAGDIADCRSAGSEATAKLLDALPGTIFTAGDNAYPRASAEDFRRCYGPTWGRHRDRTRPSPGNHDYETANAAGYFDYFGANAGPHGRGYYSYDLGSWHVVSLNSEIAAHDGSPQVHWLRQDLAQNPTGCTVAYWHKPLFSSGPHGGAEHMRPLWRTLYQHGVDLILVGHDHLYERFAPQDPDGRPDPERGIRQFTVGTGGAEKYEGHAARANSEIRGREWGVLSLALEAGGYRWDFIPVAGAFFRDSGSGSCH